MSKFISGSRYPATLLLLAGLAGPGQAQDEGTVLDAILVTAGAPDAAPADPATSAVDLEAIQGAFQGAGLTTILNGLPGVTTETSPGDPAVSVSIRGLQNDGRVVVTIDGARQNFARSGHGANGTFYTDPEMLRSVKVVRGPAGTDAGAGAIGGTLILRTLEAGDLIPEGETQGREARLRYGTLMAEPTAHLAWAGALSDRADLLLAFTSSAASDYDAGDGTRVRAENDSLSSLAKLSFAPTPDQRVTLSYGRIDSAFINGYLADILRQNDMLTTNSVLDYRFGGDGGPWTASATLYRTTTKVAQQLLDASLDPFGDVRSYDTVTTCFRAEAATDVALGLTDHRLTFVLDGFRDAVTTRDPGAAGGSLTPSGRREVWSALVEDRLMLTDTTEAQVGLRFDSYGLTSDDGSASGTALSPSLSISQKIGAALTLHARIAEGYRPPALSEALVNGQHPEPADFYIRPNPDLLPERSLTQEVGATVALTDLFRAGDTLDGQITLFRNDVQDYIGLVYKGGLFDGYYQYDNIERVRIDGLEIEAGYDAGPVFGRLSMQMTHSRNQTTGGAVSGVAPNRAVFTAGLRSADGLGEYGGRITTVAGRDDGQLSAKSWTTVDLFMTRQLGPQAELGIALNNITDAAYTQYLNTQPSPGFNATASVSVRF